MASTNTWTSNYAGEEAGGYIRPVLVSGDTLANNLVTLHEGVKYKENIKIISIDDDVIQTDACDFAAAGTSTTSEVVLTPTALMVNHEVCKNDFYDTWESQNTGRTLVDGQIPPDWERAFTDLLGDKISQDTEYNLWQGNFTHGGGSYTRYDGLLQLMDDSSSVIKQNLTNSIDAADCVDRLREATGAMTAAMIGNPDFRIKVSRKTAHLYRQAVSNDFNSMVYSNSADPLYFDGYAIDVCPGIADDIIVIARNEDLHVGCNLVSDETELKLVDLSQTTGDNKVRYIARWKFGTQITNDAQIVLAGVNIES